MLRSIKAKIRALLVFFFIMISLISFLGYQYIGRFANDSRAIMEDNFESVRYASAMMQYINDIHEFNVKNVFAQKDTNSYFKPDQSYQNALIGFESQLLSAKRNITEPQESELLQRLEKLYRRYLSVFRETYNISATKTKMSDILEISEKEFQPLYNQLEREIQQLYQINIQAIGAKSNSIQDVGTNVLFYLSLLIVLTLLVNLLLLGFFPSYLANPLIDLNQKITEVAAGNYDQKLEVKYHHADEISDLTRSFNQMSVKLSHYDDTSLSKIWREKRRAEALIYLMKEAIWVLDEHKKILHANKKAQEIVQMTENEMVGMPIYTLANQFEFIKEAIKDWLFATSSEENDYLEETLVVEYKGISETFRKYTLEITIHNEQKNSDILVGFAIVLEKVC